MWSELAREDGLSGAEFAEYWNAPVERRSVVPAQTIQINATPKYFPHRRSGNTHRQRLPRTLMPTTAKTETAAVLALRHKLLRPFVERRISISRGQQQQNHIACLDPHTGNLARRGDKAPGVLHGRVERCASLSSASMDSPRNAG